MCMEHYLDQFMEKEDYWARDDELMSQILDLTLPLDPQDLPPHWDEAVLLYAKHLQRQGLEKLPSGLDAKIRQRLFQPKEG